jgi:acyl carrier protein
MTRSTRVSDDTVRRVHKVLRDHAQLGLDVRSLRLDGDLYEAGLTSRASVNVMLGLEAEFDVEFADAMLRRDVFGSVLAICEAVYQLMSERAAEPCTTE